MKMWLLYRACCRGSLFYSAYKLNLQYLYLWGINQQLLYTIINIISILFYIPMYYHYNHLKHYIIIGCNDIIITISDKTQGWNERQIIHLLCIVTIYYSHHYRIFVYNIILCVSLKYIYIYSDFVVFCLYFNSTS